MVELLEEAQRRGRIRWFGFSFHDSFSAFEEILRARSWDLCQIQLNYMDTEHQAGLRGYALAEALGIPVVVMEPVKGGSLAQLPDDACAPLLRLDPEATPASWALRWAASLPHVQVVLSGMGSMEQLEDNLHTFQDFRPLDRREREAVTETAERLRRRLKNGCTGCGYCMPCPAGVDIPGSFQIWNGMSMYQNREITRRQWEGLDQEERPDLCHRCGQCERRCPQHLRIRAQLAQVTGDVARFLRGEPDILREGAHPRTLSVCRKSGAAAFATVSIHILTAGNAPSSPAPGYGLDRTDSRPSAPSGCGTPGGPGRARWGSEPEGQSPAGETPRSAPGY